MKIFNYSNDYVRAEKFKKESVTNVDNQTKDDRPKPTEEVSTEAVEAPEVKEEAEVVPEEKANNRNRKKK